MQVADRAMCLFESESFISIIKQYKTISFNILVPTVDYLASNHWHQMLKESLTALKEILQKIDAQLIMPLWSLLIKRNRIKL